MSFKEFCNSFNITAEALKELKSNSFRGIKEIDIIRYSEAFGCLVAFRYKLNFNTNTAQLLDMLGAENIYKDNSRGQYSLC